MRDLNHVAVAVSTAHIDKTLNPGAWPHGMYAAASKMTPLTDVILSNQLSTEV